MHVRCPHCHQPVELVENVGLEHIDCPSCGSDFSLLGDATVGYDSGEGRTIGHFELVERLGMGQFGTVWMARDTELDRKVAVKIPRQERLSPGDVEMFLREARAAAQLHHPNIVGVYEVGREGDSVYIVSDLVRGVTLADRLTAGRLSPREAATLCATIAEALHHAHETGVIHRDLKPSNIMLDADGEPHLMDFGLAKREAGEITMTMDGRVLGTPAYMSPEQARGEAHHADARSDIYSLGTILFELVTGELPFRGNKRMLMMQIIQDEPPSPRKLDAAVPRDLETICLKCLEKSPERRYSTARDLADELQRFLDGEPILARPVGRLERGWRWCKRKPAIAALSFAALLLLMTTAGVATVAYFREVALSTALAGRGRDLQKKTEDLAQKTQALAKALKAAQTAELRQREETLAAIMAEARATRSSGRVGQRFDTIDAVRRAVQLARELEKPDAIFDELRDQAVAALALPDLRESAKTWEGWPDGSFSIDFDPLALRFYTRSDQEGNVTVRSLDSDEELARLAGSGKLRTVVAGADGKSLLLWEAEDGELKRWVIGESDVSKVATVAPGECHWQQSRDGRRLLAVHPSPKGKATVIELPSGSTRFVYSSAIALPDAANRFALSPDGRWLAIVDGAYATPQRNHVLLVDVDSGQSAGTLTHQDNVGYPTWHPDSRTLAVGGVHTNDVYLWDAPSAKLINTLSEQKGGSPAVAMSLMGQLLTSKSEWAGGQVFWHPHLGRFLFRTPFSYALRLTVADGRMFEYSIDKTQITLHVAEPSPVFRILVPDPAAGPRYHGRLASVHPAGRLLAFGHRNGVSIFDLPSGLMLGRIDLGLTAGFGYDITQFDPSTGDLLTYGPLGLYRWPVRITLGSPETIAIGPEQLVGPWARGGDFDVSGDGGVIAIADFSTAAVLRSRDGAVTRLAPLIDCRGVSISPDGRWLFASSHGTTNGTVWDCETGKEVAKVDGSACLFSPDGEWLWSDRTRYKVGTWEKASPLSIPEGPGALAFSPDGRICAGVVSDEAVALFDAVTGKMLVHLSPPLQSTCEGATFSPDGSQLLLRDRDLVCLFAWDLRVLRQKLAELGLDFDAPPLPPTETEDRRLPPILTIQKAKVTPTPQLPLEVLVASQKWPEVQALLKKSADANPDDHFLWHQRALVEVFLNDQKALSETTAQIEKQFQSARQPYIRERLAKTFALAQGMLPDLKVPQAWLESIRAPRASAGSAGWNAFSAALTDLTQKDPAAALADLEDAETVNRGSAVLRASCRFARSLAIWAQGDEPAASDAYIQGLKVSWTELPFLAIDRIDLNSNWHDVLIARVLCRRAEQQLFGREQTDAERYRQLAQARISVEKPAALESGDKRTTWVYKDQQADKRSGTFQRNDDGTWTEAAADGKHDFEEWKRYADCVLLYDSRRKMFLRCYDDHMEIYNSRDGSWDRLYNGSWAKP